MQLTNIKQFVVISTLSLVFSACFASSNSTPSSIFSYGPAPGLLGASGGIKLVCTANCANITRISATFYANTGCSGDSTGLMGTFDATGFPIVQNTPFYVTPGGLYALAANNNTYGSVKLENIQKDTLAEPVIGSFPDGSGSFSDCIDLTAGNNTLAPTTPSTEHDFSFPS